MASAIGLPASSRLSFTADLEICRLLAGIWQVSGAHGRIDRERAEEIMGDKSPKSKEREQKQKGAAETKKMAAAKSKQDNQSQFQPKGKK